jgi:hypothetical protein
MMREQRGRHRKVDAPESSVHPLAMLAGTGPALASPQRRVENQVRDARIGRRAAVESGRAVHAWAAAPFCCLETQPDRAYPALSRYTTPGRPFCLNARTGRFRRSACRFANKRSCPVSRRSRVDLLLDRQEVTAPAKYPAGALGSMTRDDFLDYCSSSQARAREPGGEAPAPAGKEHSRKSGHLDHRTPSGPYIVAPGVVALTPISPDGVRYPARLSLLNGSERANQRSTGRPRTTVASQGGRCGPGVRIERVGVQRDSGCSRIVPLDWEAER